MSTNADGRRRFRRPVVVTAAGAAAIGLVAAVALSACSTSSTPHSVATAPVSTSSHPSMAATPAPKPALPVAVVTVPADLVGKQLGDAKAELVKLGFTNIVVAGGQVTDSDKVDSVPAAGQALAPSAEVIVVGQPSALPTTSADDSRAACLADASQCYMDGQQCATGGCVNAARGLSPADVQHQTNEWLAQHPGYCAYGDTGGTAPCDSGPGGRHLTDSDPEFRDGNGETKAQACARMGYTLADCSAG